MAVKAGRRLVLWLALVTPASAWYGFQQGLAMTLRGGCAAAGFPLGPLWGLASLVLCVAAGWLARPLAGQEATDRFLSLLALLAAGLFSLAILFQLLATLIIPACAR
jgi:hypothetical protein